MIMDVISHYVFVVCRCLLGALLRPMTPLDALLTLFGSKAPFLMIVEDPRHEGLVPFLV